jgi:hypothetical protein
LLTIFHYIVGGFGALFGCFPLIHFTLGLLLVFWPHVLAPKASQQPPPEMVGWFFILLGGGMFLGFQALAWCIVVAGRFLARPKHYMFVFVVMLRVHVYAIRHGPRHLYDYRAVQAYREVAIQFHRHWRGAANGLPRSRLTGMGMATAVLL